MRPEPGIEMSEMSGVLERLLRYVRYDTQSSEQSNTYPSTEGQLTKSFRRRAQLSLAPRVCVGTQLNFTPAA